MNNIFELTTNYLQLLDMENDIDIKTFEDTLESIEDEIENKIDGYGKIISQLDGEIEIIKKEIQRLNNKKKVIENRIDSLKNNLSNCMNALGKNKIKTTLYTAGFRKTPAKVYIIDEDLIDDEYLKIKKEISKEAIKEALKNGINVNGAELKTGISFNIK